MLTDKKSHFFLKNPIGESLKFLLDRGQDNQDKDKDSDATKYRRQKDKLFANLDNYHADLRRRYEGRTLRIPYHYDYIEIDFLKILDKNFAKEFEKTYGVKIVNYTNFNQTVLFAIVDTDRFRENFEEQINKYHASPNDTVPPECRILTTIQEFHYLTSEKIVRNNALRYLNDNVMLCFIDDTRLLQKTYRDTYKAIKDSMKDYFTKKNIAYHEVTDSLLQIDHIESNDLKELVDNFDVIQRVQSLRTLRIRPNEYGEPEICTGLNIQIEGSVPTVGIIDTGIEAVEPLLSVIENDGIDIASPEMPQPYHVYSDHGTAIAALASFGWDFYHADHDVIQADAKVFSIKVLKADDGVINIYAIKKAIIEAHEKYGIRLFNLSMNVGIKNYNSDISDYAYVLDELAYRYDILIFISTGNLSLEDIEAIQAEKIDETTEDNIRDFLNYPNHFYNPKKIADSHVCECTNICEPAESMNNITVGALADNLRNEGDLSDLTLASELPAFYSRKYYMDYNRSINNTRFKKTQKNTKLFKPDIVMPGGDLLSDVSKMQVLGLKGGIIVYKKSSGTSYATPLAVNFAAKILRHYPALNMQSVKALLINSAKRVKEDYLNSLVTKLKQEDINVSLENLSFAEKRALSEKYSTTRLNNYLSGHGMPELEKCLFSNGKRVVFVLEDSIKYRSHKAINLNIPEYLYEHSKRKALTVTATLCYKFEPVFGNPMSYNPVHISFNIGNSMNKDDVQKNADEYSSCRTKDNNERMAIKEKFSSWSDDFYPASSKMFSNVQKMELNISPAELKKIEGQLAIIVRCIGRDDEILEEKVQNRNHIFSLVVSLEENECAELSNRDLYSEIEAINTVDLIAETELNVDIDLENVRN